MTWKLDGQNIAMAAGEALHLNVCLPHSMENRGSIDRTNLVVQLEVNDWPRKMFPRQGWHERLWVQRCARSNLGSGNWPVHCFA